MMMVVVPFSWGVCLIIVAIIVGLVFHPQCSSMQAILVLVPSPSRRSRLNLGKNEDSSLARLSGMMSEKEGSNEWREKRRNLICSGGSADA